MKANLHVQDDNGIVQEAIGRFALERVAFVPLESFESEVYAWEMEGRKFILKLTRKSRRTREQLLGEIDFVQFVSSNGVSVARPIASRSGQYVENIVSSMDDMEGMVDGEGSGGSAGYWAYAFEWAEGERVGPAHYGPKLYKVWGTAMGRLHSLSERYAPKLPEWIRPSWEESELLPTLDVCARSSFPELRSAVDTWMTKVRRIPEHTGEFGLIHNDMHPRNFHWTGEGIVMFDFDGLTHHHYASDIAVALYYGLAEHSRASESSWSPEKFLHCFLEGYSVCRTVSAELQRHIPDWMMFRHIQLYMLYFRSWGERPAGVTERWILSRYRKDIIGGTLFGRKPEDLA
ncbi:phosphotransferase [Paenibacillus sp. FSL H8-0537]|uniref:phosphotransferase enzyme family protein n=1 Tax=Paenibacillus sp. FSL H8-0537 TaxID=2921399 RepID=UPI003101B189